MSSHFFSKEATLKSSIEIIAMFVVIPSGEKYAILDKPLFLIDLDILEASPFPILSQNEIILFPN